MTDVTTKGLIVVPAGDGEPHWIGSSRITLKATAEQTNGGYGLIVSEVARGSSAPLHIHHTAEEGIWVVSGRILVRCGPDEFTLDPGGFTSLPRGVPHTFLAEEDTTMLGLITPGGTEGYFVEGGPVATTPAPPPPDFERLKQAAEKDHCEIVGPPLAPRD
jgi:quercetin dioxygenase-like cupin family protein